MRHATLGTEPPDLTEPGRSRVLNVIDDPAVVARAFFELEVSRCFRCCHRYRTSSHLSLPKRTPTHGEAERAQTKPMDRLSTPDRHPHASDATRERKPLA